MRIAGDSAAGLLSHLKGAVVFAVGLSVIAGTAAAESFSPNSKTPHDAGAEGTSYDGAAVRAQSAGHITITEFLAENESGLQDEDGEFSDWIEIYNPGAAPVALAGYQLTDGAANWTFPPLALGARQFLVVYASGKNRTNPPAPLHTNFKLDNAGEYLALRDASNNALSEFAPYPAQRADYSAGTGTNGGVVYFFTPTPGRANGVSFSGFVADIAFNVKRGFFSAPVTVAITNSTPGAAIHYTLDGSTPTETSAPYTTPLLLSATTTLRARAFKPGFRPTKVHTGSYIFLADVIQQTAASAQAYGWPAGPINGQVLRYGLNPTLRARYSTSQLLAALRQIPTMSIVTDQENLTDPARGIYVNGPADGAAWERPVSLELIPPGGSDGFQEDCGLRIRGGQSRSGNFPKHSFHVNFRREYGTAKLRFPLFGADGAEEFDTFDLRCEHGYAYADPYPYGSEFTAVRDVFCRDLWGATGHATTRSRAYHLYLNGQYWGLYQTQERAQEDYAETYLGGAKEEYDVIKATGLPQLTIEASSGSLTNWRALWLGARTVAANPANSNYFALLGRNADGTPNPSLPVLLDPKELAAYLLLHYYCGHSDEPLSVSFNFEKPNNFRALRHQELAAPFHFFVHDGESSVRAPEWVDNRANSVNLTSPNRAQFEFSNPEWMHEDLLANAEYRIAFADEAQRLLFNGGAFTAAKSQPFFDARAAEIDQAVIGESIRWGRNATDNQTTWSNKIAEIRSLFFPMRTETVITQLRQRNLFPAIDAPALSSYGGLVSPGFNLHLTNLVGGGTLYYALGGADPRAIGGGFHPEALAYSPGTPITINSQTTIKARVRSGAIWSAAVAATFYTMQDFTKLLVSEIMYNPPAAGATSGDNFEFLELKNAGTNALDLGGATFTDGITFTFTNGSRLAPGQFFILGRNPSVLTNKYPGLAVHGAYGGRLDNAGEQITLTHALGGAVFSFDYNNSGRWPLAPDGQGFSLAPRHPNANPDPGNPSNWRASTNPGGSPGTDDPVSAILPVLVNEALTHTDPPDLDTIELFNPNGANVDIGGWFLTDDATQPRKFRIPDGTLIVSGGYRVFTEADFNPDPLTDVNSFALSSSGDQVYLLSGDAAGNLTGYSHGFAFDGAAKGITFGRHVISTGDEHFVAQVAPTLHASNSGPRVGPVVIKQIMYHPPDLAGGVNDSTGEYIEIENFSAGPVPFYDPAAPTNTWHVRGGVSFDFPTNVMLPSGGTLVLVNFNPADPTALAAFRAKYGPFTLAPVFGPYNGKLDNSRDTVNLNRPDTPDTSGVPRIVVDEVTYRDSAPWPVAPDGSGASLHRVSVSAYGDDPINWSAVVPLTISRQPASVAIRPTSNVVFTVVANGNGSLNYQWRLNGTNLFEGGGFSGVNSATLLVTNVFAQHRGDYTVLVTDDSSSVVSLPASLTVLIGPGIATQPQSMTAVAGDTVTFSVTVSNTATLPLGFRWRKNHLTTEFLTLNSHTSVLTVTNVSTNALYGVVLTNAANVIGILSATATLDVLADSDGDHVPDLWMVQSFGHTNGLAADLSRAGDDPDRDSMSNRAEYIAGTDPRDKMSYLKVDVNRSGDADIVMLQFLAMSNRSYSVQFKASWVAGSWTNLEELTAAPTNRLVILTDLLSPKEGRFYRLATPRVLVP